MEEISKKEIVREVLEKTKSEEKKMKKKSQYIIENLAIIFSVSTVFIFLVMYAFNRGYYRTFGISDSCITVELTDFLPVALQLCGIYIYVVFYLVQLKKDKILKVKHPNLLRILYGELIINYILVNAQVTHLIGTVPTLMISLALPILIEILWWKRKQPQKDRIYSETEKALVMEGLIEDRILYLINNKYVLGIMTTIILWASIWGTIYAKGKNKYQVFEYEGIAYAVIIDQGEYVIAEKIKKEDDKLFIDSTCYIYFNKENKLFSVEQYEYVEIEK